MRAHIGQNAQGHADDGRVACTHAVHAVVEISTVADGCYHKDGHDDKENPAGSCFVFAAERHDGGVVEVVPFDKRDGGLERLAGLSSVLDDHFLPLPL